MEALLSPWLEFWAETEQMWPQCTGLMEVMERNLWHNGKFRIYIFLRWLYWVNLKSIIPSHSLPLLVLHEAHFRYYKIDLITFWPEYTQMVLVLLRQKCQPLMEMLQRSFNVKFLLTNSNNETPLIIHTIQNFFCKKNNYNNYSTFLHNGPAAWKFLSLIKLNNPYQAFSLLSLKYISIPEYSLCTWILQETTLEIMIEDGSLLPVLTH